MRLTTKVVDEFIDYLTFNKGRTESTAISYRKYIERWLQYCEQAKVDVLAPSMEDLVLYTGPILHRSGIRPETRKVAIAAIRGFYRYLVGRKFIQSDPTRELPSPKLGRKMPVPISMRDMERIMWEPDLSTFIGLRDATMFTLLVGCGLRVSGVCNMDEDDLFWDSIEGRDSLTIRVTEKGKRERFVPAPPEALVMLRAYLSHPELQAINRHLASGRRVLFVTTRNQYVSDCDYHGDARRIRVQAVERRLIKYGQQAGVDTTFLRPHAIRHLYGQQMIESDVSMLELKTLMGHAKIETTEIYSHLAFNKLRRASEKGSPLNKMNTPATELVRKLSAAGP